MCTVHEPFSNKTAHLLQAAVAIKFITSHRAGALVDAFFNYCALPQAAGAIINDAMKAKPLMLVVVTFFNNLINSNCALRNLQNVTARLLRIVATNNSTIDVAIAALRKKSTYC